MQIKNNIVLLSGQQGMSNIFSPIFNELSKEWEIVSAIDPFSATVFKLSKYYHMLSSFKPDVKKWRKNYRRNKEAYHRSPSAYRLRTEFCERKLKALDMNYNLIFQISSMFMPSFQEIRKPYAIYIDRTTIMTERYFEAGLRFRTERERDEYNQLMRQCFDKADLIFTFNKSCSLSVVNDYYIKPEKVLTVNSGVNLPIISDLKKTPSKLVITVCEDYERHGGRFSLDIFRLVQNKVPDAEFLFIGKLFENIPIGIKHLDFLPYDKLKEIYAKAAIVIMPASIGGLQTMTEAMAYKCVCIANNKNPYVEDLIINGETGFCADDREVVADLVVKVLNDTDIQEFIGQNAHRHICNNYTWASTIGKISRHLKELNKTNNCAV